MRRLLVVSALFLAVGCGRKAPVRWDRVAASDAVKVLRADSSPYHIIYNPPVDLAKKPGS